MCHVEVYDCHPKAATIAAIKYLRELRGLGLAEAKRLVDEVYYRHITIHFEFDNELDAAGFAEKMTGLGFQCRFGQRS